MNISIPSLSPLVAQIIQSLIHLIPHINANNVISCFSTFFFILTEYNNDNLPSIQPILLNAINVVLQNSNNIPPNICELVLVYLFILKAVIEKPLHSSKQEIFIDKSFDISNFSKCLSNNIAFSYPLATAMILSHIPSYISINNLMPLFYAKDPNYHLLLQYFYAYIIQYPQVEQLYSFLFDFIGSIFCGIDVQILNTWISNQEVSLSSVGKNVKTPNILLSIALEVICMLRHILEQKVNKKAKDLLIKFMVDIILSKQDSSSYTKQLIAVLAVLSNSF